MKRPFQVGITGGIGSGKSLVCRIFQSLGAPVYNADTRARELMVHDKLLVDEIRKQFGSEAYLPSGELDRDYLAGRVFKNPDQLQKLNKLTHPRVKSDYAEWVKSMAQRPYVIKEAALIFEANLTPDLDVVIVVSAPEPLRLKRVMERDPHRSREAVEDIIRSQMSEHEKLQRADFVIINDESELVVPQVLRLHEEFVNKD